MSTTTSTTPRRLWIGCLASYNAGRLHGEWIDADEGPDAVGEALEKILESSPEPLAEEWIICDWEGFPQGAVWEYADPREVAELAETLAELEETYPPEAVAAWIGNDPSVLEDPDELELRFSDAYCGEYEDGADYAASFYEDTGTMPEGSLASYIDWPAVWRGEFESGEYWIDGGHVFRSI